MKLYNEIGFYKAITEAKTAASCALHLKRLTEAVVRRAKFPLDVRVIFIEDVYALYAELWGEVPDNLAHALSSLYMQEDTSGGLSGANKYAPCSNLEYSFFSSRTERRIATEDYFHESAFGDAIENSATYADYLAEENYKVWLEQILAKSNLRIDEDYVFRRSVLEGISLREMEGYKGMSKSTLGRRLKDAKIKVQKAITKYGGRG